MPVCSKLGSYTDQDLRKVRLFSFYYLTYSVTNFIVSIIDSKLVLSYP
jgi:hypothetical protein